MNTSEGLIRRLGYRQMLTSSPMTARNWRSLKSAWLAMLRGIANSLEGESNGRREV